MVWKLPLVPPGAEGAELTAGQDGTVIRRSILPGGVRVITEQMPGLRSASIGAWLGVGSRDESSGHYGSTHFLEHLLFKGTKSRSAVEIATAFDEVGGESNAGTGKEHTVYFARILDTDLPMAVDVISDMLTSALIDEDALELERGVILEELAMNEDDPSDVVHEKFATAVLGTNPLGRPIGGTPATIKAVPRGAVWEHYQGHYRPETLVVTAAGGVDHETFVAQVQAALKKGGWDLTEAIAPAARRTQIRDIAEFGSGSTQVFNRKVEQANVIVGSIGIAATDERRFALTVMNTILGGSMSSRLFQEIRERRGLVYATYSFASSFSDTGIFGMYAGCAPGNVAKVEELLHAELEKMGKFGPTPEELTRAKGQLSGSIVLGLEDTGSRMSRMGMAELVHGELLSIEDSLARINAVTAEQVQAIAAELAARPRTVVKVGPFEETK
ncbi:MAG: insulinase family protein [Promicromonosporaceae bacterium]|nr:insulinase family protein [Promicromonosporaceae bacterium]